MEVLAANIAYTFHFPPSEINEFDELDFIKWSKQAERIQREIKRQSKG